jgi:hypothetical protein
MYINYSPLMATYAWGTWGRRGTMIQSLEDAMRLGGGGYCCIWTAVAEEFLVVCPVHFLASTVIFML